MVTGSRFWTIIYFFSFNILAVYIVMNVLVSFLIDAFRSKVPLDVPSESPDGAKFRRAKSAATVAPDWRLQLNEIALLEGIDISAWDVSDQHATVCTIHTLFLLLSVVAACYNLVPCCV